MTEGQFLGGCCSLRVFPSNKKRLFEIETPQKTRTSWAWHVLQDAAGVVCQRGVWCARLALLSGFGDHDWMNTNCSIDTVGFLNGQLIRCHNKHEGEAAYGWMLLAPVPVAT